MNSLLRNLSLLGIDQSLTSVNEESKTVLVKKTDSENADPIFLNLDNFVSVTLGIKNVPNNIELQFSSAEVLLEEETAEQKDEPKWKSNKSGIRFVLKFTSDLIITHSSKEIKSPELNASELGVDMIVAKKLEFSSFKIEVPKEYKTIVALSTDGMSLIPNLTSFFSKKTSEAESGENTQEIPEKALDLTNKIVLEDGFSLTLLDNTPEIESRISLNLSLSFLLKKASFKGRVATLMKQLKMLYLKMTDFFISKRSDSFIASHQIVAPSIGIDLKLASVEIKEEGLMTPGLEASQKDLKEEALEDFFLNIIKDVRVNHYYTRDLRQMSERSTKVEVNNSAGSYFRNGQEQRIFYLQKACLFEDSKAKSLKILDYKADMLKLAGISKKLFVPGDSINGYWVLNHLICPVTDTLFELLQNYNIQIGKYICTDTDQNSKKDIGFDLEINDIQKSANDCFLYNSIDLILSYVSSLNKKPEKEISNTSKRFSKQKIIDLEKLPQDKKKIAYSVNTSKDPMNHRFVIKSGRKSSLDSYGSALKKVSTVPFSFATPHHKRSDELDELSPLELPEEKRAHEEQSEDDKKDAFVSKPASYLDNQEMSISNFFHFCLYVDRFCYDISALDPSLLEVVFPKLQIQSKTFQASQSFIQAQNQGFSSGLGYSVDHCPLSVLPNLSLMFTPYVKIFDICFQQSTYIDLYLHSSTQGREDEEIILGKSKSNQDEDSFSSDEQELEEETVFAKNVQKELQLTVASRITLRNQPISSNNSAQGNQLTTTINKLIVLSFSPVDHPQVYFMITRTLLSNCSALIGDLNQIDDKELFNMYNFFSDLETLQFNSDFHCLTLYSIMIEDALRVDSQLKNLDSNKDSNSKPTDIFDPKALENDIIWKEKEQSLFLNNLVFRLTHPLASYNTSFLSNSLLLRQLGLNTLFCESLYLDYQEVKTSKKNSLFGGGTKDTHLLPDKTANALRSMRFQEPLTQGENVFGQGPPIKRFVYRLENVRESLSSSAEPHFTDMLTSFKKDTCVLGFQELIGEQNSNIDLFLTNSTERVKLFILAPSITSISPTSLDMLFLSLNLFKSSKIKFFDLDIFSLTQVVSITDHKKLTVEYKPSQTSQENLNISPISPPPSKLDSVLSSNSSKTWNKNSSLNLSLKSPLLILSKETVISGTPSTLLLIADLIFIDVASCDLQASMSMPQETFDAKDGVCEQSIDNSCLKSQDESQKLEAEENMDEFDFGFVEVDPSLFKVNSHYLNKMYGKFKMITSHLKLKLFLGSDFLKISLSVTDREALDKFHNKFSNSPSFTASIDQSSMLTETLRSSPGSKIFVPPKFFKNDRMPNHLEINIKSVCKERFFMKNPQRNSQLLKWQFLCGEIEMLARNFSVENPNIPVLSTCFVNLNASRDLFIDRQKEQGETNLDLNGGFDNFEVRSWPELQMFLRNFASLVQMAASGEELTINSISFLSIFVFDYLLGPVPRPSSTSFGGAFNKGFKTSLNIALKNSFMIDTILEINKKKINRSIQVPILNFVDFPCEQSFFEIFDAKITSEIYAANKHLEMELKMQEWPSILKTYQIFNTVYGKLKEEDLYDYNKGLWMVKGLGKGAQKYIGGVSKDLIEKFQ